jgi:OmpA-OmpF porin, OOP family
MPDSLYTSLLNTLDKSSIGSIARALGQGEQSVSRCLEMSITSIFAALASKGGDTGALHRMMDLAPSASDVNWSQLAGEVSKTNSPLLSGGKRLASGLFGNSEGAVTNSIGRECGLPLGTSSAVMSMAAPMVIGFLSRHMRSHGMDTADLGRALQRESPAIREALPADVRDLISPATTTTRTTTSPVIAQAVRPEGGSARWIPAAIAVGLALFGLFWLLGHRRQPAIPEITRNLNPQVGTANREMPSFPTTGTANRAVTTPGVPNLNVTFKTGAATLLPDSRVQLRKLASSLAANPGAHMAISGYTDNVGNAARNLRLAQARANSVKAELVRDGISPDRLTAHAYGEQSPIADNSSMQGRAQNRRVTIERMTIGK